MREELQIRMDGEGPLPTLIYLPGLHGDWTLIGGFRRGVAGRVRFVEMTYPRTLTWSLEDYAAGIESGLAERGIHGGWLLAESFGSQVAWTLAGRSSFRAQGIILAGGFVRHPSSWAVRLAEKVCGRLSLSMMTRLLFVYTQLARLRFRKSPEVLAGFAEFVERRTELDRDAAVHRLRLILSNDFCAAASGARVPVYGLTGLFDPVVPWFCVRRWLKRNCPALREYRVLAGADHTVLASAPQAAADQVVAWVQGQ